MAADEFTRGPRTLEPLAARLSSGVQLYGRPAVTAATFTAVMVHGGLDGARSFTRLARRLDEADVVAYDRRGYRASRDAWLTPGLDVQVADLRDVVVRCEDLGFAMPFVIVGHSYGGLIGLAACVDPPLGAAVVAYEPPFPWLRADHFAGRPALTDDGSAEAELFFRRMVGDGAWERLGTAGQRERLADGPALLEDLRVLRGHMPFEPAHVSVPATLGLGDPAEERRRGTVHALQARMRTAAVQVLDGAGHGAHLSSPDRFAELVRVAATTAAAPWSTWRAGSS